MAHESMMPSYGGPMTTANSKSEGRMKADVSNNKKKKAIMKKCMSK